LDAATGMYYYGARYYDSRLSIFINVDQLAEKTMTPYQYVNNNPIRYVDPGGGYEKLVREGAHLIVEQTIKRSGNLRKALGVTKANQYLYKGMQAHHLIPVDLLKKNKVVKDSVLA